MIKKIVLISMAVLLSACNVSQPKYKVALQKGDIHEESTIATFNSKYDWLAMSNCNSMAKLLTEYEAKSKIYSNYFCVTDKQIKGVL